MIHVRRGCSICKCLNLLTPSSKTRSTTNSTENTNILTCTIFTFTGKSGIAWLLVITNQDFGCQCIQYPYLYHHGMHLAKFKGRVLCTLRLLKRTDDWSNASNALISIIRTCLAQKLIIPNLLGPNKLCHSNVEQKAEEKILMQDVFFCGKDTKSINWLESFIQYLNPKEVFSAYSLIVAKKS